MNLATLLLTALLTKSCLSIGLKNNGNTCFTNAALQLLHQSKDFKAALSKSHDSRAQDLLAFLKRMNQTEGTLNPVKIIPRELRDGQEHDVEEFLASIRGIEGLDLEAFRVGNEHELKLDIVKGFSLQQLLNLRSGNETPSSLLINLKRGSSRSKKNIEPVEVSSYVRFNGKRYKLAAFIEHQGSSAVHGHFRTFFGKEHWFVANDESVIPISLQEALYHAPKGYIFLFEQK